MSKKGSQTKGKVPATKPSQASTPVEKISPLQELLQNLFEQAESRLVKADQRTPKESVLKVVSALESVAKGLVTESKSEGLQKHAIKCVLAIQMSTKLGPVISKKIVSRIFTYLVDEIQRNWKDYGFQESEVHQDYIVEFQFSETQDGLTYKWDVEDISPADFQAWEKSFTYLNA